MLQNPSGEYEIPAGYHNSNSQTPIHDELDDIYQNQETARTSIYNQSEVYRGADPRILELNAIANDIDKLREAYLGSRNN
jgi:hypothetical protein